MGETIYNIGQSPECLFILLSGRLVMETEIVVDEVNRFPTSVDQFAVHTTKRKIKYEVKEIELNEIFGHEELVAHVRWQQNGEQGRKPVRKCRIIATQNSEVLYLNVDDFY